MRAQRGEPCHNSHQYVRDTSSLHYSKTHSAAPFSLQKFPGRSLNVEASTYFVRVEHVRIFHTIPTSLARQRKQTQQDLTFTKP